MLRINHNEACELEALVRCVYNCDRFGIMGLADADNFEVNPWQAAILILAPKFQRSRWSRRDIPGVIEFLNKYEAYFESDSEYNSSMVENYIDDLTKLVKRYYRVL